MANGVMIDRLTDTTHNFYYSYYDFRYYDYDHS